MHLLLWVCVVVAVAWQPTKHCSTHTPLTAGMYVYVCRCSGSSVLYVAEQYIAESPPYALRPLSTSSPPLFPHSLRYPFCVDANECFLLLYTYIHTYIQEKERRKKKERKKKNMQLRRRLPTSFPLRTATTTAATSLLLLGLLPYIASAIPLLPTGQDRINADSKHVCIRPAPWTQIFSFFLTNYIARIATFKKTSGYEGSRDYLRTAVSLFVPFFGISQAASTIARGSRFLGKDELGRALHAGTLCVVQRKQSWRPKNGDVVRGCMVEAPRKSKKRRAGSNARYFPSP